MTKRVKLIGIPYTPIVPQELIPGSLAVSKKDGQSFFVNEEVKFLEIKLQETTRNFFLRENNDVYDLYIVSEDEISPGEECIIVNPNQDISLVRYRMPDHDAVRSWKSSEDIEYKIIAYPNQIAYVREGDKLIGFNINHVDIISNHSGYCDLEIDLILDEHEREHEEIRFIKGKVVINI
jgi:hypothetical protein